MTEDFRYLKAFRVLKAFKEKGNKEIIDDKEAKTSMSTPFLKVLRNYGWNKIIKLDFSPNVQKGSKRGLKIQKKNT